MIDAVVGTPASRISLTERSACAWNQLTWVAARDE
jgi:hypothetical protein